MIPLGRVTTLTQQPDANLYSRVSALRCHTPHINIINLPRRTALLWIHCLDLLVGLDHENTDVADGGRGKSEFPASANGVAGLEEDMGRAQRCTAVVTDAGVVKWTLNKKGCEGYEVSQSAAHAHLLLVVR